MNPALPGMPEMPEPEGTLVEGADIWEPSYVLSEDGYAKDTVRAYGESCFAAGRAEASKDAGFALVPKEPTDEMLKAGRKAIHHSHSARTKAMEVYRAMLEAALSPPAATPTKEQV